MRKYWKTGVAIGTPLGSLMVLYMAAEANHHTKWFFWFLGFVAFVALLVRPVQIANERIFGYGKLLKEIDKLQDDITVANEKVLVERDKVAESRKLGVIDGLQKAVGADLASRGDAPMIVGITEFGDSVALVAAMTTKEIPLRAMYTVEVIQTGASLGVVQAYDYNAERKNVYLRIVEAFSPLFWEGLLDRVQTEWDPPKGVHLVPFVAPIVETLELELTKASSLVTTEPETNHD